MLLRVRNLPSISVVVLAHCGNRTWSGNIKSLVLLSHLMPKSSGFSFTVNLALRKMKGKKKVLLSCRGLGGTMICTYSAFYAIINSRKKRVKSMTLVVFYNALHSFSPAFNCYMSYSTRNPAEILAALGRNYSVAYSFGN